MKFLFVLLITGISGSFADWQTDFEKAKKLAKENDRYLLLNFSGSDWCGPCIRLKKEVFESDAFSELATSSLVLFNADFPRSKKNQLPKDIQERNDALAGQYNPLGKFPFTLLLTADGRVIKTWEGFPGNDSRLFIDQIKSALHANNN
ncbi:thiol-disulfide isomerase [Niastella vici]|uniref:Thiol-disulfide isomerase n=1 Tax=Niastella vici TaxID=1703345 RepID=A0A1V9G032_9BACT|nr:thioredoxin family protein [Niastella vici]OQP63937.1 thiol-disulfide isomerase [Niastella vici]